MAVAAAFMANCWRHFSLVSIPHVALANPVYAIQSLDCLLILKGYA